MKQTHKDWSYTFNAGYWTARYKQGKTKLYAATQVAIVAKIDQLENKGI